MASSQWNAMQAFGTKDKIMISDIIQCSHDRTHLDVALSLSKAEGNLRFLSGADSATMTQADAVEHALKAVKEARKLFKQICREKNS